MNNKTPARIISLLLAIILCLATCVAEESYIVDEAEWAAAVEADNSVSAEESTDEDDWTNVLLLGCDSYTTKEQQRTDSMIILSVNMKTSEVKMTSLMRDTWIKSSSSKGYRKLTELCAVGGPQLTIQAINENFGTNIDKYALISMAGIAEVIDLVGGLDLDVTEAERKALNKGLFDLSGLSGMEKLQQSGEKVHLNGNQATAYARIRKIDSDYVRTERQRTVLIALAEKIRGGASAGTLLTIVDVLLEYVETNLSLVEIMSLASVGLTADLSSAKQLRLPADGTFESGMFGNVWCIKPNFDKNKKILREFIYG
ncbi:MAG: LCP family protein [Clostridia bacterium]|nr:LCP family protein [Clostridia bacterium]